MEHASGRALEGSQRRLGDSDRTRAVVGGRAAILPICRGRLVLSRAGGESAPEAAAAEESISRDPGSGNGATSAPAQPRPKVAGRTRKNKDGLPEGWVIDEEGYVVPRHG